MTAKGFIFHKNCKEMELSICALLMIFFVFANGDVNSIKIIKAALHHFQEVSGLKPNLQKSLIYSNYVDIVVRSDIVSTLNFQEESLPVKYLGPFWSSLGYLKITIKI